jgi:hypothetical protein
MIQQDFFQPISEGQSGSLLPLDLKGDETEFDILVLYLTRLFRSRKKTWKNPNRKSLSIDLCTKKIDSPTLIEEEFYARKYRAAWNPQGFNEKQWPIQT